MDHPQGHSSRRAALRRGRTHPPLDALWVVAPLFDGLDEGCRGRCPPGLPGRLELLSGPGPGTIAHDRGLSGGGPRVDGGESAASRASRGQRHDQLRLLTHAQVIDYVNGNLESRDDCGHTLGGTESSYENGVYREGPRYCRFHFWFRLSEDLHGQISTHTPFPVPFRKTSRQSRLSTFMMRTAPGSPGQG